tara:strand:+ start:2409 stop:2663 length:255 start_codon:yes stop_codon:yes gene_type:complete
MASLVNTVQEEYADIDLKNGAIVDRQRVLHGSSNVDEAKLLQRAHRASLMVNNAMVNLHAHPSHAYPLLALVEPDVYEVGRRMG